MPAPRVDLERIREKYYDLVHADELGAKRAHART